MTWVQRAADRPVGHRCEPPFKPGPDPNWPTLFSRPIGHLGDLWRCDDCRKLWRIGRACGWCDHYGDRPHRGGHEVGETWRPATLWQRIKYRRKRSDSR